MWPNLILARKALSCGSVLVLGSLSAGCTSLGGFYQLAHGDQFVNAFNDDLYQSNYQSSSYTNELSNLEKSANDAYYNEKGTVTDARARADRNDYISMKMFNVDHEYFEYTQLLYSGDIGAVSFADFAQLGLTTAATAIPVVQTTKILATAATAVGGGKAIYNQDVLKTQTLQAIESQMDADRSKIKTQIVWRMANCQISQYPMGFVLSDLQAYASAGTVQSAIGSLASSASKAKQANSSPATTASSDGTGGGSTASDPNAKSVDVNGGKLTYSFKPTTQCPLVPVPTKNAAAPGAAKKVASLVQVSGTLQLVTSNRKDPGKGK